MRSMVSMYLRTSLWRRPISSQCRNPNPRRASKTPMATNLSRDVPRSPDHDSI
jgi:hypothetical protein